jgi:hypothetical protein
MNFCPGEYDAGASSASTRGETTQCLSAPLNHFRILTAGVSCKFFFEMMKTEEDQMLGS